MEECQIRWDGQRFVVDIDRYTFRFATIGNQRGDAYFIRPISRSKHGTSAAEIEPEDERCLRYQRIATEQLTAAISGWRLQHPGQLITDEKPFVLSPFQPSS